ncbi:hypothetical protein KCU65_g99, partial [Aureobasidium melanogenum]
MLAPLKIFSTGMSRSNSLWNRDLISTATRESMPSSVSPVSGVTLLSSSLMCSIVQSPEMKRSRRTFCTPSSVVCSLSCARTETWRLSLCSANASALTRR